MKKIDEISDRGSCWNKAGLDERIFVLLARDVAAPAAIRAWVRARIKHGRNKLDDAKIQDALDCAAAMEHER